MFTSSGREFGGLEMDELGFTSTRFFTVSLFSSIILVRGGHGSFGRRDVTEGHKSVDYSGEGVTVRKLTW